MKYVILILIFLIMIPINFATISKMYSPPLDIRFELLYLDNKVIKIKSFVESKIDLKNTKIEIQVPMEAKDINGNLKWEGDMIIPFEEKKKNLPPPSDCSGDKCAKLWKEYKPPKIEKEFNTFIKLEEDNSYNISLKINGETLGGHKIEFKKSKIFSLKNNKIELKENINKVDYSNLSKAAIPVISEKNDKKILITNNIIEPLPAVHDEQFLREIPHKLVIEDSMKTFSISSIQQSPGFITIKGYIKYYNRNNQLVPAKWVTVYAYDSDLLGSVYLGNDLTDNNGYYEIGPISNDDGWLEGSLDVYIRFVAANSVAAVRDVNDDYYDGYSCQKDNVPDGDVWFPGDCTSPWSDTYRPPDSEKKAWWIFYTLIDGWNYLRNGPANYNMEQSTARWADGHNAAYGLLDEICDFFFDCGGTHYHDGGQIHLDGRNNGGHANDPDVILHEYGHNVMYAIYDHSFPTTYCGKSHTWYSNEHQNCAWTEGWASFMPLSVYNDGNLQDTYQGFTIFYETNTDNFGINWDTGDDVEGRVTGALWDIFDSQNDGYDTFSDGFTNIWDVVYNQNDDKFSEFWEAWKSRGHNEPKGLDALYQNTINYFQSGSPCSADVQCPSNQCEGSTSYSKRCCSSAPPSDGWYGGGDNGICTYDDPTSYYRDYYCTNTGSYNYETTSSKDCDSQDNWYNYGDSGPGCSQMNDPTASHRDYYVTLNTNICTYATCETKDCDSYDGWYGGGNTQTANCGSVDDDAISAQRDYYVTSSGSCSYTTTNCAIKDCDNNDKWYDGGNNLGCGSDPSSYWRDYYVITNSNTCTYTTSCNGQNSFNCDSYDICYNICNGNTIVSYKDEYVYLNSNSCVYNWGNIVENCDNRDGCSGLTYYDYYCSSGSCAYASYPNDPRCCIRNGNSCSANSDCCSINCVNAGVGPTICCSSGNNCVDSLGICRNEYSREISCNDGNDNDCDGNVDLTDQDCIICVDSDGDSYYAISYNCPDGNDCNDNNPDIYPNSFEICDGVDNNCNGQTDEELQRPDCSLDKGVCINKKKTCLGNQGWQDCANNDYGINYEVNEASCDGLDNDCDGNIDENICTYNINLNLGWNLISLPLSPSNKSVKSVFNSINGNYSSIFAYNSSDIGDEWKSYNPSRPDFLNTLKEVDETMGIWIKMLNQATLTIIGTPINNVQFILKQGWNLMGYPSRETKSVTEVLENVSGEYSSVFMYNASDIGNEWKSYDPARPDFLNTLRNFTPGYGYWVKAVNDTNWSFDGIFSKS